MRHELRSRPVDAFASTPVSGGDLRSCSTTARAPNAAAERNAAPTFCGSVTPSRISTLRPSGGAHAASSSSGSSGNARTASPDARRPAAACRRSRRDRGFAARRSPADAVAALRVATTRSMRRAGLASAAKLACTPQIQDGPPVSASNSRRGSGLIGRARSGLSGGGGLAIGRAPRNQGLGLQALQPSRKHGRKGGRVVNGSRL